MKGAFFPLYSSTWEVGKVIEACDNASCSLEVITYKTKVLLFLLSGRRGGCFVQICVADFFIEGEYMVIKVNHKTKSTIANTMY